MEGLSEQREMKIAEADSSEGLDAVGPQAEIEEATEVAGAEPPRTDEQKTELYYEGRDIVQAMYAHMDHMGG